MNRLPLPSVRLPGARRSRTPMHRPCHHRPCRLFRAGTNCTSSRSIETCCNAKADRQMRKLIDFDDDTFDKLKQLGRDRMATLQELADEGFADLLKKHGIPVDLKDALRKSARLSDGPAKKKTGSGQQRKSRS